MPMQSPGYIGCWAWSITGGAVAPALNGNLRRSSAARGGEGRVIAEPAIRSVGGSWG